MTNANKTYIIQNRITKEMFVARSGKTSWKQPAHAKNAWNQSFYSQQQVEKVGMQMIPAPTRYNPQRMRAPFFSEQDVFEIVELKHEMMSRLDKAVELLKLCQGRVDHAVNDMIKEFLSEGASE